MSIGGILLVDGDPEALRTLSADLGALGYQVTSAADGRQALLAAQRTQPFLIVLDVVLPDATGLEVLRQLRTLPSTSGIPVIATAAGLDPTLPMRVQDLGASAFLLKPFEAEDLARTADRILREHGAPLRSGPEHPQSAKPTAPPDASTRGSVSSAAAIWAQFAGVLFERLATIEAGVAAFDRGALTADLRQRVIQESHRLAGSLGMLGLRDGTRVAREIERLLTGEIPFGPDPSRQLAELAGQLRQILEKGVD